MENDLTLARKKKLEYIIEKHKIPYPERYEVNYQLTDAGKLPDGTQNVLIWNTVYITGQNHLNAKNGESILCKNQRCLW